jgi:hypothetical protein
MLAFRIARAFAKIGNPGRLDHIREDQAAAVLLHATFENIRAAAVLQTKAL